MQLLYIVAVPVCIVAMLVLIALSASGGEMAWLFWLMGIGVAIGAGWLIDNT